MRIAVLGAGALGSLFGGLLAAAGEDVVLLGRPGDHVAAVNERGLVVRGADRERTVRVRAETDPAAAADADVVLVCVKSYDTGDAVAGVAPHLDGADVCTFQNGLGNAETIAERVPPARVIAGTTAHGAVREAPGVVRHAGAGPTRVGRYFAPNDDAVDRLAATLTDAGIETRVAPNARDAVWEKVLVNVGINATTALARVPNGALVAHPAGDRLLTRAVEEAARVARAEGRDVPDDAVARARAVAEATATNRSSMRQDLEAGRPTEIAALNGAVVSRADDRGIDAPVNRTLADLVRLAESDDAGGDDGDGE